MVSGSSLQVGSGCPVEVFVYRLVDAVSPPQKLFDFLSHPELLVLVDLDPFVHRDRVSSVLTEAELAVGAPGSGVRTLPNLSSQTVLQMLVHHLIMQ